VALVGLAAVAGLVACSAGSTSPCGQSGVSICLTDAPIDLTLNLLDFQNGQVTFLGSRAVPSSKVDVPVPFELTAEENLAITIDFNAQASVQVTTTNGKNSYVLRPVINVAGMKSS